jgi:tRNA-2-methylthio-N6-dimethylallyladenosine synthase
LRGVEKDRPTSDVLAEVRTLVDQGVIEITLLGQNVNAYGVELGERGAFARLLKEVAAVDGLERLRFMSPHPRDFTDDVIEVMASTPVVMPHLHMPLQSGSDSILASMRRSYRSDRFLGILERVRKSIPQAMITTDIIVGFPGETEADFSATLDIASQARFAAAYTYKYSIRPGTPAGEMTNQVPEGVVGERYTRLHEHQQRISLSVNQEAIGSTHQIMVTEVEGRRDAVQSRLTGRSQDFRLVHFDNSSIARPGDFVDVEITDASAHYLIGRELAVTPTRGGDAHAKRNEEATKSTGVTLGMPTRKVDL